MLSLLEVGGSLLERVAVGNPLSLALAASAFVLSLGYLLQLGYRRHVGSEQRVRAGGGPGKVVGAGGERARCRQGGLRGLPGDGCGGGAAAPGVLGQLWAPRMSSQTSR